MRAAKLTERDWSDSIRGRVWRRVRVNTVDPNACWEWRGYRVKGYGRITLARGVHRLVHRLVYEMVYGLIGAENLSVCHTCDNPSCVRPDHLFLGTSADNTRDMVAKGRGSPMRGALWHERHAATLARGTATNHAKVSEDEVRAMRELRAAGIAVREIARRYPQISRRGIQFILRGRNWAHVT